MSLSQDARRTATQAADNPLLEMLTRAGFIGYGITHLLLAWLALQIAFAKPAAAGDQGGALNTLTKQPMGVALVVAISIGLAAMALWQALEAAVGHRTDRGTERVLERVASAGRALFYGYLAYTGMKVVTEAQSSSAAKQQAKSADLMSSSGGRWLVGLIGVVLAGIGIGMIIYGLVKRFEKHLHVERMSPKTRQVARRLGIGGYTAKGIAYGIAGVLLVSAAVTYDPDKARGLDAALRTLAGQPYGGFLLTAVALGIAAFGVFCFVQARYRKV
ncbi:MAG TPA: DUF1206 domain-containing protein [Pilimelia sp.]|nr:DUF1206 domain-containing protein [Pilimelia sp.]